MAEAASLLEARARSRGMMLPDKEVVHAAPVIWDGRAMQCIQADGSIERTKYTYRGGENMVGHVEQPCSQSTRLIGGEYRRINAPNATKEGHPWKPGNRYSNQNTKLDAHVEGETVLINGKFRPYLLDSNAKHFKSGKILWSEHRFRNIPGLLGHAEYEKMTTTLAETGKWEKARPPSKYEPGFAEYTTRDMDWERQRALAAPLPESPAATTLVREANGNVTVVPDTSHVAKEFGATQLVPARRGALPNSAAAFAVHPTDVQDLRWLTRTLSQRTAGNVPIKGPGGLEYFEGQGVAGGTLTGA